MKELSDRIQTIIESAGGTWGISLEDLDKQKSWHWNADELFYAASIIKVPIMIAAFNAFDKGEINWNDTIELTKEDMVGGAGVIQHMTPGTLITVFDMLTLMIIQSDNTATNILIDLLGKEKIQDYMKQTGLNKSEFFNKLMIVPADIEGVNQITAGEMTHLLKQMVTGKIISVQAGEQMVEMMKKQQINNCLPARLPSQDTAVIGVLNEWELAHKTGSISGIQHDIGVFYVGKRKMIASVLSEGVDDYKSQWVIAEIGLAIYEHMKK